MKTPKRLFRRGQRVVINGGSRVFTVQRYLLLDERWVYGLNEHPSPGRVFPESELSKA